MTQAIQNEMSLGQFIKQLAGLLHDEKVALPFKNQKPWHLLLYQLAEQPDTPGKPTFLNDLVFDWDASYPKCQELSAFLHALHFTANVSIRNPHYDVINMDDEIAHRWAQQLHNDDRSVQEFVNQAAEIAKREFSSST